MFTDFIGSLGARILPGFGFKPFQPLRITPVYFPAWIVDAEVQAEVSYKDVQVSLPFFLRTFNRSHVTRTAHNNRPYPRFVCTQNQLISVTHPHHPEVRYLPGSSRPLALCVYGLKVNQGPIIAGCPRPRSSPVRSGLLNPFHSPPNWNDNMALRSPASPTVYRHSQC